MECHWPLTCPLLTPGPRLPMPARHGNRVARQRINFPSCFPAYTTCAAAPTEEEAHERFRNEFLALGKAREAAAAQEEERESPRNAIALRSGRAGDGTTLTRQRTRTRLDPGNGASTGARSPRREDGEGRGEDEGEGGNEAAPGESDPGWASTAGQDPDPAPAFNIRWVAPVYVVHVSDPTPCREQWRFEEPPGVDVPRLFRNKLHACLFADASAMRYHGTSLPPRLNYPALVRAARGRDEGAPPSPPPHCSPRPQSSLIGHPLRGAGERGARLAMEAQLDLLARLVKQPLAGAWRVAVSGTRGAPPPSSALWVH